MATKKETTNATTHKEHGTQGGSHEQHVKAGKAGGEAPHTCRGRECLSMESKHSTHGSHEQHVKAGKAGGEAPHTCRGRECSNKK